MYSFIIIIIIIPVQIFIVWILIEGHKTTHLFLSFFFRNRILNDVSTIRVLTFYYRPYYRALVHCLTRRSWSVRKHTRSSVNRILSLLGGASICLSLIEEFKVILQTQTVNFTLFLSTQFFHDFNEAVKV